MRFVNPIYSYSICFFAGYYRDVKYYRKVSPKYIYIYHIYISYIYGYIHIYPSGKRLHNYGKSPVSPNNSGPVRRMMRLRSGRSKVQVSSEALGPKSLVVKNSLLMVFLWFSYGFLRFPKVYL